jgi:hypothetical protein
MRVLPLRIIRDPKKRYRIIQIPSDFFPKCRRKSRDAKLFVKLSRLALLSLQLSKELKPQDLASIILPLLGTAPSAILLEAKKKVISKIYQIKQEISNTNISVLKLTSFPDPNHRFAV